MKEWVPLNTLGTYWEYGDTRILRARQWLVLRSRDVHWTEHSMAGAARVAMALEALADDGAKVTSE